MACVVEGWGQENFGQQVLADEKLARGFLEAN